MDFIEFLQSGASGAVRRIKFDGKTFSLENGSGFDTYFELYGDTVKERGGMFTGYGVRYYHNTIVGEKYYTILKDGDITGYKIILDDGYAKLKYLDNDVYYKDKLKNSDKRDEVEEDSGEGSSLLIKIIVNLVLGLLISYLPPLIFRKFIINAKRGEKYGNGLYFFAVIIGLFVFGGMIISPMIAGASLSFLGNGSAVGINGISYCYVVCHVLNLLVYFLAKPISSIFKSERAINITFAVYLIIFIALEATFIGIYLKSLYSFIGQSS